MGENSQQMKACIYCQGGEFDTVYQDARLQIVKCCSCGLVRQADYARTLAQVNQVFANPELYYETRSREEKRIIHFDAKKLARTADIRSYILHYLKPHSLLLDVGSGRGEFASALQSGGLNVIGLEPDPVAAQYAREELSLNVEVGIYHPSAFEAERFEAITFIQVLEHVEDPLETLQCAYRHLKPGGLLVVDVPSFNNPRILIYRVTRQARWVQGDFIISHNYYFTRQTLSLLVKKAGFTVLQVLTGRYAVKFGAQYGFLRPLLWTVDKATNTVGIGGITLYAFKGTA
jgi:2-polyprenyl-3-methyl-5-hydroxy-6-metoxy-1,4-benzoquinol methylase